MVHLQFSQKIGSQKLLVFINLFFFLITLLYNIKIRNKNFGEKKIDYLGKI